ncbi:MAG TPA: TlpA disulfide reductase family protein [Bacteroidia bacterium]|nr:TlpA disulfide reductase family protein [Bacteroidia bacterium]
MCLKYILLKALLITYASSFSQSLPPKEILKNCLIKAQSINNAEYWYNYKAKKYMDMDLDAEDTLARSCYLKFANKDDGLIFHSEYGNEAYLYDADTLLKVKGELINKQIADRGNAIDWSEGTYNLFTTNGEGLKEFINNNDYLVTRETDTVINSVPCYKLKILKIDTDTSWLQSPSRLIYLYISQSDSLRIKSAIYKRSDGFDFYWIEELKNIKINHIDFEGFRKELTATIHKTLVKLPEKSQPPPRTERRPEIAEGDIAPNWKLPIYLKPGDSVELYSIKSKYTLLDFWYVSCAPCLKSIPEVKTLKDSVDEKLLTIVALNTHDNDYRIGEIDKRFHFNYTIACYAKKAAEEYGIDGFPHYLIIDNSNHKIVYSSSGYSKGKSQRILDFLRSLETE